MDRLLPFHITGQFSSVWRMVRSSTAAALLNTITLSIYTAAITATIILVARFI